ncbi:MAG: TRAP transporter large permease [Desulfotomaculum sp.]|nr:TRAP transporter large permease [Desulfotomaculum sp.]
MILLLVVLFCMLLLLGIPVAVVIGVTTIVVLFSEGIPLMVVPQRMFAGVDSFPLIAIPFFILAGDLLAKGKISERLIQFADSFLGFLRGGLWVVTVKASMFFAAISGSGAATTAAVGSTLIPELRKKGYDPPFSAALVAAGGCAGIVIPPSVPMIIYAVMAEQSAARLFMNGIIPGILIGLTLMSIALYIAYKNNYPKGTPFSAANIWRTFKGSIWGLMTPVIILGGIFSGYFTPSEAAVIAVNWALIVAVFIYRDMGWQDIFNIVIRSAVTTSVIMFIIATSSALSWVLAKWQIPNMIAGAVLSLSENTLVILLLINLIILFTGIFMETASALIILTPIFLPLVIALEVDLIHFGIIMMLGLAIGMITPPVAINLYIASIVSNISIGKISRAVVPLIGALIFVLLIVTYVPLFFDVIF